MEGFIITLYKFDLVSSKKVRIQEYWVMGVEDKLRVFLVEIVVMKDIHDAHQSHRMQRCIEFINNQSPTCGQSFDYYREHVHKADCPKRFKRVCSDHTIFVQDRI
jgi:hypothetical protein